MRKMKRTNGPSISFVEFCHYFRGVRIVKSTYNTGTRFEVEVPKYLLYWAGISPAQIREKYTLINR